MLQDIEHIIFDLDGTLIDSSAGVIEATNYALAELGEAPRQRKEIIRYIGYPLEDMFASFTKLPADKLAEKFQEKARITVVASTIALPGVEDTLRLLYRARFKMGIATTKYDYHTEAIIKKLNWANYFSATASGNEVEKVKPHPDLVRLAIDRLGGRAEKTIMVGDTVNDILAARAAGIPVIAIRSKFGNDDLRAHRPNLLLPRFTDLKTVFNL